MAEELTIEYLQRVFGEPDPSVQMCGDCIHFGRCQWLIQARAFWTECDWTPSRFVRKLAQAVCPECHGTRRVDTELGRIICPMCKE